MKYVIKSDIGTASAPPGGGSTKSVKPVIGKTNALRPKVGGYHAYKTASSDQKRRLQIRKRNELKEEKRLDEEAGIPKENENGNV